MNKTYKRILVIEDCLTTIRLINYESKDLPVDVVIVDTFRAAEKELRETVFDLLVIDNNLEKETHKGYDMINYFQGFFNGPIACCSADPVYREDVIHLNKPFNIKGLLDLI